MKPDFRDVADDIRNHFQWARNGAWTSFASRDFAEAKLREAWNAALEEAAEVAGSWESPLKPGNEHRLNGHKEAARDIAAKLCALKDTPHGETKNGS